MGIDFVGLEGGSANSIGLSEPLSRTVPGFEAGFGSGFGSTLLISLPIGIFGVTYVMHLSTDNIVDSVEEDKFTGTAPVSRFDRTDRNNQVLATRIVKKLHGETGVRTALVKPFGHPAVPKFFVPDDFPTIPSGYLYAYVVRRDLRPRLTRDYVIDGSGIAKGYVAKNKSVAKTPAIQAVPDYAFVVKVTFLSVVKSERDRSWWSR